MVHIDGERISRMALERRCEVKTCVQILSKLGEHYHPRGTQLVDEQSFLKMRANLKRWFAKRIPIYRGHPDEFTSLFYERELKSKEVGSVNDLILTEDAILVVSEYSDEAYESVKNGQLLSPRWEMQSLGNNYFRPIKLISIGLTNNPNIRESGIPFKVWEIGGISEQKAS